MPRIYGAGMGFIGRSSVEDRSRGVPGQGTDDTDLTWAVLAAYLDDSYTLERAAGNMLDWYHTGPPDIGGATARAMLRLERTGDPRRSGGTGEYSYGNGSLMRCIPTALARADNATRRTELAEYRPSLMHTTGA